MLYGCQSNTTLGVHLHSLADFDEGGSVRVGGRVCEDTVNLQCTQEPAVCARQS